MRRAQRSIDRSRLVARVRSAHTTHARWTTSSNVLAVHAAMRLRAPEHLLRHHARIASITPTSLLAHPLKRYSTGSKAKDVAIIGGGITGLSAAYFLTQELPNTKITIYETAPRVGGWLASKHVEVADGRILFEQGPRTLRNSQNGRITAQLVMCETTVHNCVC